MREVVRRLVPEALRPHLRRLRPLDRRSAYELTRRNSRRAYEALYGSNELLEEYLHPDRLAFFDEVAAVCAGLAPRSVVDVGCGSGHLLRALADRVDGLRIVGIDHAATAAEVAGALVPEGRFVVADLYGELPDEQFDLVLCTEVLEHLTRPAQVVDALHRLCTPAGRIVVTVPDGAVDDWEGHVNFWSEDELRAFLAPHGLAQLTRIDGGRTLLAVLEPKA